MGEVLTITPTLAIIAAMLAAIGGLVWLEKRPHEFGKMRWPTTPLIFLSIFVIVIMAAHLLTLLGMHK
ncbi:MAG: hypothetical protein Q7S99_08375 [Parvibaculum sp.]|nr:hypothetical protein [Parvibaculum sp.]|tara:strand:- start:4839 stop:5042 length:204 start_codon:yes stop_codon:yes gene_type:complete